MHLEPLIRRPGAWTGVHGRLAVHVFEGRLTLDDMKHMETVGDGWYRKNPGRVVELVIVFPSDHRMTSEERQRMTELIRKWEKARVASASVILATGIAGAMQRSVLTGFTLLAPPPHPMKVFGSVPLATAWLAPHVRELCGPSITPSVLLSAVQELCTAFQSRTER